MASQTRELAQLQKGFGTTPWSSPEAGLWTCEADDDRPGWRRHIETDTSRSAGEPNATVRQVEALLRSDGYDVSRSDHPDGGETVDGEKSAASDGQTVEIDVSVHVAGINLTGCVRDLNVEDPGDCRDPVTVLPAASHPRDAADG